MDYGKIEGEITVYTVTKNKMSDNKKWEYKITKAWLGYNVYRVRDNDGYTEKERLQKTTYTLNRNHARIFYHIDEAISALVIERVKGTKKIGLS